MKQFELLDIFGDAGIRAFGKDPQELFINAAFGMYSLITDLREIREIDTIDVKAESGSFEGLFISWLNELVFRFDTYGFIGGKIIVDEFTPAPLKTRGEAADVFTGSGSFAIKASLSGEEFDPERHERKLLIKAATYHKLKIERIDDIWRADVIFDI